MKLSIKLSGSVVFLGQIGAIPPIGTILQFRTQQSRKGYPAGSIWQITVDAEKPPLLYIVDGQEELILDANGFLEIERADNVFDEDD